MAEKTYLAVDLGASSGRAMLGRFDGERLTLEELHRFENGPVEIDGRLFWDLLRLWAEVKRGLRAAGEKTNGMLTSVGVDTWGVDFGLLARGDELLGNPYHYRDARTNGMLEKAFGIVTREEIFQQTGLQFLQFNTLYQLLAMKLSGSPLLDVAEALLMMPDLFHWFLCGVKCNEATIASTSQFYNPVRKDWAVELLPRFSLPTRVLGKIVPPGTVLGPLRSALVAETGLTKTSVVLPASHDTGSAVLAVPADSAFHPSKWCYISLGTWALMGVEEKQPIITDQVLRLNFTNEGGAGGTIRLLKNIAGLWLLQECRRVWNLAGANLDWEAINQLAAQAPPWQAIVDPDAPEFLAPENMPETICEFCRRTGQTPPADRGAIVRCALESIALKFRHVLGMCEELTGGRIDTIHIVGGGVKNRQLCQAAADACNRRVLAGPVEATAVGNLLMQAVAAGDLGSIADARQVVARSFAIEEFTPRDTASWEEAYGRFLKITSGG